MGDAAEFYRRQLAEWTAKLRAAEAAGDAAAAARAAVEIRNYQQLLRECTR